MLAAVALSGCAAGRPQNSAGTAAEQIITSVTPSSVEAGSKGFTLVVKGLHFDGSSRVLWNGTRHSTTLVDQQTLNAAVTAIDLSIAQSVAISVQWGLQSQVSNAVTFVVKPAPAKPNLQITTSSLPGGQTGNAYAARLTAQGGTAPYKWSILQGALPSGLSLDPWTGEVTGLAQSSGTFMFTAQVEDSSATPLVAESALNIAIVAAPAFPGAPPSAFYGPGIGSDALGNTPLGPNQQKLSYRFRAKETGNINDVRIYLIMDHPGYSAGTGGNVLVSLETDDGTAAHNPSGTKLSSKLIPAPFAVAAPARYFPLLSFSPAPRVIGGELYHVVFENTDASPTVNYVSVNSLYQAGAPTPVQPTLADVESAVLMYQNYWPDGLRWKPRQGYTPIVQLEYADGLIEGQGYMEVWVGVPEPISGDRQVRESFTVSGGAVTVASVAVRLARVSGADNLTVRLEAGDGTLIESGTASALGFPTSSPATYVWARCKFSRSHTLATGETYRLVLQAPATSTYQAFPLRKGLYYGFKPATYFPDGFAEFRQNGAWTGWTQWGATNRVDGDLQFYFELQ
jgi:putative Ig domain-containing protein